MILAPPRLETRRHETHDLKARSFRKARAAEETYTRQLHKVAERVQQIVDAFDPLSDEGLSAMQSALVRYSKILTPWARATAARMVYAAAAKNRADWAEITKGMSVALKQQLGQTPIGLTYADLIQQQVGEITSIPQDAAQRLFEMATGGLYTGVRSAEFAKQVMLSGEVSRSRANMLGRTAVGIASSKLTEARARSIGSTGYTWLTAGDAQVRPSHRKMNGRFVEWNRPPTLDGYTAHAGEFANCRCVSIPEIPEV